MNKINSKWIYAALSVLMLGIMVYFSNIQSLWYDELFQLGLVGKNESFANMIHNYAQLWDYTPPFFAMIAWVWVRIVPLTARWLLIPSELFVTIGVYVLACIAHKLAGKRGGIIACLFGITSSTLMYGAGHEFRAYALFFMASSICLYCFCNRFWHLQKNENNIKYLIFYGLSMVLLAYSHYYGCLIIAALLCADIIWWLMKRQTIRACISYVLVGICFIPWMIVILLEHKTSLTTFWTEQPTWKTVVDVIFYLVSENHMIWIMLLSSVIFFCVKWFKKGKKEQSSGLCKLCVVFTWVIVTNILGMFFYATVINKVGGAFYDRYFIGLIPYVILLITYGTVVITNQMGIKKPISYLIFVGFIAANLLVVNYSDFYVKANKRREPYERTISILKKKADINDASTAVIFTDDEFPVKGYQYLFNDRTQNIDVDFIIQDDEEFGEKIQNYKKLYLLDGHMNFSKENRAVLDKYFVRLSYNRTTLIGEYVRR